MHNFRYNKSGGMSKILIYLLVAFFVIAFLELGYFVSQQLENAVKECGMHYHINCTIQNAFRNIG